MAAVSLSPLAPVRSFLPRALVTAFRPYAATTPCIASSSTSSSPSPSSSSSFALALSLSSLSAPSSSPSSWWPSYLPSLPSLDSLLELFPPILLAVPKSKITHSRKSMRSANKGLKNRTNLTHCEACGTVKLAHNLCPTCFSQISRRWKKEARGELPSGGSPPSAA